jgi:hypothetical protein
MEQPAPLPRHALPGAADVPERPVWFVFSDFAPTEGRARIVERSDAWRKVGALQQLAIFWLLAPVAFFIPPHIPWVLLLLGIGAMRAWNRLHERRTVYELHGVCPKCGTEQDFSELGRMREPVHTVQCASCRWELRVSLRPPP